MSGVEASDGRWSVWWRAAAVAAVNGTLAYVFYRFSRPSSSPHHPHPVDTKLPPTSAHGPTQAVREEKLERVNTGSLFKGPLGGYDVQDMVHTVRSHYSRRQACGQGRQATREVLQLAERVRKQAGSDTFLVLPGVGSVQVGAAYGVVAAHGVDNGNARQGSFPNEDHVLHTMVWDFEKRHWDQARAGVPLKEAEDVGIEHTAVAVRWLDHKDDEQMLVLDPVAHAFIGPHAFYVTSLSWMD